MNLSVLQETASLQSGLQIDLSSLCCPYEDRGALRQVAENQIICVSCGHRFISMNGCPILIDESKSIFSSEEIASLCDKKLFPDNHGWRNRIRKLLPAAASRDVSLDMLERHMALLPENPDVLVVGCGHSAGKYANFFRRGRVFPTDVTLQGDAFIACDGVSLPFRDATFDLVILDQMLECALDPSAVIKEACRCLKPGGLVYSGVPFFTPVHGFPYDFQRYTPMGHRILFRRFQEIEFRITQGPVSATSLTMIGLFASFSNNVWWGRLSSTALRVLFRPLLWIDRRYISARDLTILAASAFLGQKLECDESTATLISRWRKSHK